MEKKKEIGLLTSLGSVVPTQISKLELRHSFLSFIIRHKMLKLTFVLEV